jgi:hypothetical protein
LHIPFRLLRERTRRFIHEQQERSWVRKEKVYKEKATTLVAFIGKHTDLNG